VIWAFILAIRSPFFRISFSVPLATAKAIRPVSCPSLTPSHLGFPKIAILLKDWTSDLNRSSFSFGRPRGREDSIDRSLIDSPLATSQALSSVSWTVIVVWIPF